MSRVDLQQFLALFGPVFGKADEVSRHAEVDEFLVILNGFLQESGNPFASRQAHRQYPMQHLLAKTLQPEDDTKAPQFDLQQPDDAEASDTGSTPSAMMPAGWQLVPMQDLIQIEPPAQENAITCAKTMPPVQSVVATKVLSSVQRLQTSASASVEEFMARVNDVWVEASRNATDFELVGLMGQHASVGPVASLPMFNVEDKCVVKKLGDDVKPELRSSTGSPAPPELLASRFAGLSVPVITPHKARLLDSTNEVSDLELETATAQPAPKPNPTASPAAMPVTAPVVSALKSESMLFDQHPRLQQGNYGEQVGLSTHLGSMEAFVQHGAGDEQKPTSAAGQVVRTDQLPYAPADHKDVFSPEKIALQTLHSDNRVFKSAPLETNTLKEQLTLISKPSTKVEAEPLVAPVVATGSQQPQKASQAPKLVATESARVGEAQVSPAYLEPSPTTSGFSKDALPLRAAHVAGGKAPQTLFGAHELGDNNKTSGDASPSKPLSATTLPIAMKNSVGPSDEVSVDHKPTVDLWQRAAGVVHAKRFKEVSTAEDSKGDAFVVSVKPDASSDRLETDLAVRKDLADSVKGNVMPSGQAAQMRIHDLPVKFGIEVRQGQLMLNIALDGRQQYGHLKEHESYIKYRLRTQGYAFDSVRVVLPSQIKEKVGTYGYDIRV